LINIDDNELPTIISVLTGCCTSENLQKHHPKKKVNDDGEEELNAGTFITNHIFNHFIKPYLHSEGEQLMNVQHAD